MTLLIALVTGLVGAVLAFLVADPVTKAYHVSNMEGGRAMLIVFVYAPGGFLLGGVTGLILARSSHAVGLAGHAKTQALAILVTALVIGAAAGVAWLGAEHPPTLNGRRLALELDIRLPLDSTVPKDLHAADLHASLDEGDRYTRFAQLGLDSAVVLGDHLVVSGTAGLFTRNAGRTLLVGMGTENSAIFNLTLPGSPRAADLEWTPWLQPDGVADPESAASGRQFEVRYRVR